MFRSLACAPNSKVVIWASEMAHWGKRLVAKHETPNSIPGTHMMGGENRLKQIIF